MEIRCDQGKEPRQKEVKQTTSRNRSNKGKKDGSFRHWRACLFENPRSPHKIRQMLQKWQPPMWAFNQIPHYPQESQRIGRSKVPLKDAHWKNWIANWYKWVLERILGRIKVPLKTSRTKDKQIELLKGIYGHYRPLHGTIAWENPSCHQCHH